MCVCVCVYICMYIYMYYICYRVVQHATSPSSVGRKPMDDIHIHTYIYIYIYIPHRVVHGLALLLLLLRRARGRRCARTRRHRTVTVRICCRWLPGRLQEQNKHDNRYKSRCRIAIHVFLGRSHTNTNNILRLLNPVI